MIAAQERVAHCIAIVANNIETEDGLHDYLRRADISAQTLRGFSNTSALPPRTTAAVILPDDFDTETVLSGILSLREARPKVLLVVVTSNSERFRPALGPHAGSILPVVLPKPAFGWTILDAIRAYAHSEARR